VYSGRGFGGQIPLFLGIFFNLLGFLRNPPKFSSPYKKISNPSLENFLDTPLKGSKGFWHSGSIWDFVYFT